MKAKKAKRLATLNMDELEGVSGGGKVKGAENAWKFGLVGAGVVGGFVAEHGGRAIKNYFDNIGRQIKTTPQDVDVPNGYQLNTGYKINDKGQVGIGYCTLER